MKAGALITVLADGVWAPDRAFRHGRMHAGNCVMCNKKNAGVEHLWWDCPALHNGNSRRLIKLRRVRATGKHERCLWTTGLALKRHSWARETDAMKAVDVPSASRQHPVGVTVYTDGSGKDAGARRYAGWSIYCRESEALTTSAPLLGSHQTASKGEVRAIIEVAERATYGVHIVTDSKYAMEMALEIMSGGRVPEGTHERLWARFQTHAHKISSITK